MSVITSRFDSKCARCGKSTFDQKINWTRGVREVTHVVCPAPTFEELVEQDAIDAVKIGASAFEELWERVEERINQGTSVTRPAAALLRCADLLLDEYDARQTKNTEVVANDARIDALARIKKGVYRVSLTGLEKKYGLDYVNIQLTPNEKYGSVSINEYHGVGVGFIDKNGRINYWRASQFHDATYPSNPRVQAVVAALDIVLGSADPIEYARAYAIEAAACWRCGADLVDELSRQTLMGDTCFKSTYGMTQRQWLKQQAA